MISHYRWLLLIRLPLIALCILASHILQSQVRPRIEATPRAINPAEVRAIAVGDSIFLPPYDSLQPAVSPKRYTLTPAKTAGPVAVVGRTWLTLPGQTTTPFFAEWTGGGGFTTVPAGKFLLITIAQAVESTGNPDKIERRINVRLNAAPPNSGSLAITQMQLVGTNFTLLPVVGGLNNPLLIVRPGGTINVYNVSNSEANIEISLRGFLVDKLDFNP